MDPPGLRKRRGVLVGIDAGKVGTTGDLAVTTVLLPPILCLRSPEVLFQLHALGKHCLSTS